jgi:hypothetical protein
MNYMATILILESYILSNLPFNMIINILILALFWTYSGLNVFTSNQLIGAWQSDSGILVFTDQYFSYSEFTPSEFKYTYGGSWEMTNDRITYTYEYHTQSSTKVGTEDAFQFDFNEDSMILGGQLFRQLDEGTPGSLAGAWLFYNRIIEGQLGSPREADNPRKTMKILSGTRFQWIAYNTETKEFSGTGGGTYTTVDGKYTENIDFFSRDINRVGASLQFDFDLQDDEWHHSGLSSKGDPIHEIWKLRK